MRLPTRRSVRLPILAVCLALAASFAPTHSSGQIVVTLGDNPIHIDDGLTLDADGNLYGSSFVNGNNGRVRKVTPEGVVSVYNAEIAGPLGHDFDDEGNLYVASFYDHLIYRVDPDGNAEVLTNEIQRPSGIVIGADGNLYVAAYGFPGSPGDKIHRVTPEGVVDIVATSSFFNGPVGIDFDENGDLYVGSYNLGHITRVDVSDGSVELLGTVPGPTNFNTGYICYANDTIYATGIGTHKLYELPLDTLELVEWAGTGVPGHLDGDAGVAQFNQPNGMVASATGDTIYISEYGNKTVRMIITGDTSDAPEVAVNSATKLQLGQSWPNPSHESTRIRFALAESSSVLLQLFDANGREVSRLVEGTRGAGSHDIQLDTHGLASGVYTYRLQSNGESVARRLTVVH